MEFSSCFDIHNANANNLCGFNVSIPKGQWIAVTGPSGSGKSSLVFDIIYRSGSRNALDRLTASRKRYLVEPTPPGADSVDNLGVAFAMRQSLSRPNIRSTLATMTRIQSELRSAYLLSSQPTCPETGKKLVRFSDNPRVEAFTLLGSRWPRSEILVIGMMNRDDEQLKRLVRLGFSSLDDLERNMQKTLARASIDNSKYTCLRIASSDITLSKKLVSYFDVIGEWPLLIASHQDDIQSIQEVLDLSSCLISPSSLVLYPSPSMSLFSYNVPPERGGGMCPECRGTGLDATYRSGGSNELSNKHSKKLSIADEDVNELEDIGEDNQSSISSSEDDLVCNKCMGKRYSMNLAAYQIEGLSITELLSLSPVELLRQSWLEGDDKEDVYQFEYVFNLVSALVQLGLGHIPLGRSFASLSLGERQRARLAVQVASGLHGATYVLDEPSQGLHKADLNYITSAIESLVSRDSTVITVDHNAELQEKAQYTISLGPGSGPEGGQLLSQGVDNTSKTWPSIQRSVRIKQPSWWIHINGLSRNNIESLNLDIPCSQLVGVCGVSGSGKTSLIEGLDILLQDSHTSITNEIHGSVVTDRQIDRAVLLGQMPPPANPLSIPATVLGIHDFFRKEFARTDVSRSIGLRPIDFSLTSKSRLACGNCSGIGYITEKSKTYGMCRRICEVCGGKRFLPMASLSQLQGRSIIEILELSLKDIHAIYLHILPKKYLQALQWCEDLLLGHLLYGQPFSTLSGGEVQRLRFAQTLSKSPTKKDIFLLDEPSRGLHSRELNQLGKVLRGLADGGTSVIDVEHDIETLRICDQLIELGPGAGVDGGHVIASGPPAAIASLNTPTGKALRGEIALNNIPPAMQTKNDLTIAAPSGDKIPLSHGQTLVLTGPSGSGKTQIAVGGIYSLCESALYAGLGGRDKSKNEDEETNIHSAVLNPRPAFLLSIDRSTFMNLETVGSVLEATQLLARVFISSDQRYCPRCGCRLNYHSSSSINTNELPAWYQDDECAFKPKSKKGTTQLTSVFADALGVGTIAYNNKSLPIKALNDCHSASVTKGPFIIASTLEIAQAIGGGTAVILDKDTLSPLRWIGSLVCLECGWKGKNLLTEAFFDRQHPLGGCHGCNGTGHLSVFDRALLFEGNGLVRPLKRILYGKRVKQLADAFASQYELPFPQDELSKQSDEVLFPLLYGYPYHPIRIRGKDFQWNGIYQYALAYLKYGRDDNFAKSVLETKREIPCVHCLGTGYSDQARTSRLAGMSINEAMEIPLAVLDNKLIDSDVNTKAYGKLIHIVHHAASLGLGDISLGQHISDLNPTKQRLLALLVADRTIASGDLLIWEQPGWEFSAKEWLPIHNLLSSMKSRDISTIITDSRSRVKPQDSKILECSTGKHFHEFVPDHQVPRDCYNNSPLNSDYNKTNEDYETTHSECESVLWIERDESSFSYVDDFLNIIQNDGTQTITIGIESPSWSSRTTLQSLLSILPRSSKYRSLQSTKLHEILGIKGLSKQVVSKTAFLVECGLGYLRLSDTVYSLPLGQRIILNCLKQTGLLEQTHPRLLVHLVEPSPSGHKADLEIWAKIVERVIAVGSSVLLSCDENSRRVIAPNAKLLRQEV